MTLGGLRKDVGRWKSRRDVGRQKSRKDVGRKLKMGRQKCLGRQSVIMRKFGEDVGSMIKLYAPIPQRYGIFHGIFHGIFNGI